MRWTASASKVRAFAVLAVWHSCLCAAQCSRSPLRRLTSAPASPRARPALFYYPAGLALHEASGTLYVADSNNNEVRSINVATANVTTLATVTFSNGATPMASWVLHPHPPPPTPPLNASHKPALCSLVPGAQGVAVTAPNWVYAIDYYYALLWQVANATWQVTGSGACGTQRTCVVAGSGVTAWADGTATLASFTNPAGLAADANGTAVYVADRYDHRVRKFAPASGNVTTLAGNGTAGYADGPAASAMFREPTAVAVDSHGTVFVADSGNNLIRVIAHGVVTTLAGGNASVLFADGLGPAAAFNFPRGVAVDSHGTVYVADASRVRAVSPAGLVTTIAGGGYGAMDGTGATALFTTLVGIAVNAAGSALWLGDTNGHTIRQVTCV